MELKKEFMMRKIDDENLLIPIGDTASAFNGIVTLNEVGAFIWEKLPVCADEEALLRCVMEEYEVDEQTARADLSAFLKRFREAGFIA